MTGAGKRFWHWMLALGAVVMLLRAANIGYILHCAQRDGVEYYWGPDSTSNVQNAEALFDERPLQPIFRERIAYPFLLAVGQAAGLEYRALLWLTPPLEILAVPAMAWLAWTLTRRRSVAALAAVLYGLNPNAFQLSATLMPDWLNAQVMLLGLAALLDWARTGRRQSAWAAAVLLPLSQTIRPTLFLVIGPMAVLLWKGFWSPARRRLNLALCAAVLVYPAVNVGVNIRFYGVPNLLLSSGYQLHQVYVSYVRALERNAEQPDSLTRLYFDEKHNVALNDPREILTDPYGHNPISPDFARNYRSLVADSRAFLRARWPLWLQAGFDGLHRQLFYLPRIEPDGRATGLYPGWLGWAQKLHKPALFFAFCGVWLLIRRLPWGVTLFYAGCTAIIAMAVTGSWHDSVRVRVLVDLLYTPVIAAALLSRPAWLCLGGLAAVAYVPRRFFHLSAAYMVGATTVVLLGAAAWLLRVSGVRPEAAGPPA